MRVQAVNFNEGVVEVKKSTVTKAKGSSTKKTVVAYAFEMKSGKRFYVRDVARQMDSALGPQRKVVKMLPAPKTDASKVLVLACGHKRVATPRPTLRCRRCRKEG